MHEKRSRAKRIENYKKYCISLGLKETSEAFFLACATALLVCHTSVSFGMLYCRINLSYKTVSFVLEIQTQNQFIFGLYVAGLHDS